VNYKKISIEIYSEIEDKKSRGGFCGKY